MPKITIPEKKGLWSVNYFGEFFGDIIQSFNLSLHLRPNYVASTNMILPHTTGIGAPSSFINTNADGSDKFWAAGGSALYKTSGVSTAFTADTLTDTPAVSDADLLIHKRVLVSGSRYDVLLSSMDTNIAKFDKLVSATIWVDDWWTGNLKSISSSTNASPIAITTTAVHGFVTGDKVVIRNHLVNTAANGEWTITYISTTAFSLNGSTGNGVGGATGTVNRFFDTTNGIYFLGQPALTTGVPHPLKKFGNLTVVGDGDRLHSIAIQGETSQETSADVVNSRMVFTPGYELNWIETTQDRIFVGLRHLKSDVYPSVVVEYDPLAEQIREYTIQNGRTVGYVEGNIMYVLDIKGVWYEFKGTYFEPFTNFPSAFLNSSTITLPHRNGFAIIDGKVNALIPSNSVSWNGGVWVYDKETKNLYPKYSFALSNTGANSFGSGYISNSWGALFLTQSNNFFAGAIIGATASTTVAGVFSSIPVADSVYALNRGYFVTAKIPSSEIDNIWRNILVKYSANDRTSGQGSGTIVVKYRTKDHINSLAAWTGTWASTTTFTIASGNLTNVVVGDEIFVLRGQGAGLLAHITAITGTTTKTVTIDETLPFTPSGTFLVMFENWKKISTTITDNTSYKQLLDLDESEGTGQWVQFKVEIRGAFYLEELQAGYQPNLAVEK